MPVSDAAERPHRGGDVDRLDDHVDIEDRLGRKAGDRCRSDVLDPRPDYVPQRLAQRVGDHFELG